jgi:CheY-like chemotaxis protein
LINCFGHLEVLRDFIQDFIPGKLSDLNPYYERIHSIEKENKIKKSQSLNSLIISNDPFYQKIILLALKKIKGKKIIIEKIAEIESDTSINLIFLVDPKIQEIKKIEEKKETNLFAKNAQVICLYSSKKKEISKEYFHQIPITHQMVKDISIKLYQLKESIHSDSSHSAEKKKILFVDDDSSIHEILKLAFKNKKMIEITFSSSGQEALSVLEKKRFDLIVIDQLQQKKGLKDTPVIFLTATDDPNFLKKLKKLKPKDIISKPFNIRKFPDQIMKVWK